MKRRLLLLALVLPLLGCGSTTRVLSPFTLEDGSEAGGWAVLQIGPGGTVLRFVPKTTFGLGLILRSHAAKTVTLLDVRTLDPPGSLVHNTGDVLRAWNPPRCSGAHSCPGIGFLQSPYAGGRPAAVVVKPGAQAAAQLNFAISGCDAVPLASHAVAQQIVATYRVGGTTQRQLIPLRSQRLKLRFPSRRDCEQRPHSEIAVTAPFSSGSTWTIPTSSGDTCSRTRSGALVFTSRLYQAPNEPAVRIEIRLPRTVRAVVGIGSKGWRTFGSRYAVVTVTSRTTRTVGGRFHATFMGRRRTETFRAYGAWRCLLR